MEVKVIYAEQQLDSTVNFIAKNNYNFYGQKKYIRECILKYMKSLALNSEASYIGTMGFLLLADRESESIDNDENICRIEIAVDPSLGAEFSDSDYAEFIAVD